MSARDLPIAMLRLISSALFGRKKKLKIVFPDRKWIWIGNPTHPDHDQHGMRNEFVPSKADILVLGNSQSYCKLIKRQESWPSILAQLCNKTVYNCSVNGWSILQMYLSYQQFQSMQPKTVLLTVYPGFEIYETFKAVRESEFPLAQVYNTAQRASLALLDLSETEAARETLSRRVTKRGVKSRAHILRAMHQEGFANAKEVEIGNTHYFLQDDWRGRSMDLSHPAVKEGLAIFKDIFSVLLQECRDKGSELKIVLIPTKEYLCLQEEKKVRTAFKNEIQEVGEREKAIREDLINFFRTHEVDIIDPAVILGQSLDVAFHPDTENGHYSPKGAKIIGEYIHQRIAQK